MPWGVAAVAGASLIGSSMQAGAAGDAADAQQQSAAQADATQRYMYDQTRADNAPFLANGTAGSNKLAYLLGIGGSASGANSAYTPVTSLFDTSQDQWRPNSQLYASSPEYKNAYDQFIAAHQAQFNTSPATSKGSDLGTAEQQLQEDGFNLADYNKNLISQSSAANAANTDPAYGSLLKKFDATDLANDPVYNSGLQFGLDQGTGAINQRALQSGGYDSGATLKALTQYANDYGSTKANDAYNRYNTDQTNVYNRLAGISGSGQTASAQVGAAGTNMANQVSNNQTDSGNARAAGIVGGANAWNGAIQSGVGAYNNYNSNQTLQALVGGNSGSNNWYSSTYGGSGSPDTSNFQANYYGGT